MTLIEFLAARYDEAEATARVAAPSPWIHEEGYSGWGEHDGCAVTCQLPQRTGEQFVAATSLAGGDELFGVPNARHIAANDPAAVLADLAVKRELLDLYNVAGGMSRGSERYDEWQFTWVILNKIVLMEAARYADHPDYNPHWKRP